MHAISSFTKIPALIGVLILLVVVGFPAADAVSPPPPGGFAGNNTAVGTQALQSLTTGTNNAATGFKALFHNTIGVGNTAEGAFAVFSNTTGSYNQGSGFATLYLNQMGNANTAYGRQSLYNNTGGHNIAFGFDAGFNLTTGSNNICIGNQGVAGESGIVRIGTLGLHTDAFLPGRVQATDTNARFVASGASSAGLEAIRSARTWFVGAAASDADFKVQDITDSKVFINIDDAQGAGVIRIGLCGQLDASFPIEVSNAGNTTNGNGAHLTGAGVWTDASSRAFKENFKPVDKVAVLEKVAELPVQTWTYKGVPGVEHMGPVAEDFKDTFGLGDNEKYLASLDSAGVALAAIQGLNEVVKQKETKIQELEKRLSKLEKMLDKAE